MQNMLVGNVVNKQTEIGTSYNRKSHIPCQKSKWPTVVKAKETSQNKVHWEI